LQNICPNCGGGFVSRPIRPASNWQGNNFLGSDPASTTVKHRPVDLIAHAELVRRLRDISPAER
jgi:hypothetical protein